MRVEPPIKEGGLRLLLVDDDPGLRALLRTTFEAVDVAVDEAADATAAQQRIAVARPDAIVLDVSMIYGRVMLDLAPTAGCIKCWPFITHPFWVMILAALIGDVRWSGITIEIPDVSRTRGG